MNIYGHISVFLGGAYGAFVKFRRDGKYVSVLIVTLI